MKYIPSIWFQIPSWLQHLVHGVTWRGDKHRQCVYLTFDDGPVPEVTPQVLDILDTYGVKATFFWVGENVYRYPDLAREVCRRGHTIANHTFNHLPGRRTNYYTWRMNCQLCDEVIANTLGSAWNNLHLFRPPHGRQTRREKHWLRRNGYHIVLWDVITHDYNTVSYTPKDIVRIVKRYTRNGSIILFHDSVKSAANTLAALPEVLAWLQQQGYTCEPIKQVSK
ncbi:MAG: polysaccharide deacetylase family protein [Paludibacteraceae bacterium]|nr:polysaccharide deacetylase family protein [Paludibacteraceae bacterium]